ncbi:MAG: metal ABC transporter substrate-binding protein [Clostridia bacterium]|nr:metal ABC transporter substrate-binding protein [Clostridia bacterium]
MQKVGIILLIAVLVFLALSFCFGCNEMPQKDGLLIITTIYSYYDFAREVCAGVDGVRIEMLLHPGAESHTFEPTPKDIILLEQCDLFLYTGGENDFWVTTVVGNLDNKDMEKVSMLDLIVKELEQGTHLHIDPHVWTSLRNAQQIVSEIAARLALVDASHAEAYLDNASQYNDKLKELDEQFSTMTKNALRDTFIVADRFPLKYFVEDYGLHYYAAFDGCSAGTEMSTGTIALLSDKVKELGVPVVFVIELSKGDIARTVTENTNATISTFYTCHNVTAEDFETGRSYYDMMLCNYHSLSEALH